MPIVQCFNNLVIKMLIIFQMFMKYWTLVFFWHTLLCSILFQFRAANFTNFLNVL